MAEVTEAEQRDWLAANAGEVLREVGVTAGATVLDFGCGPGRYSIPAARLVGPDGRVYAVDMNADHLAAVADEVARRGLSTVTILNTAGDVALPLPQACCDVALLFDVLQLVDEWPRLFAELYRVLRAGAALSVFPMHVDTGEVRIHAHAAGFADEPTWRWILNFRK